MALQDDDYLPILEMLEDEGCDNEDIAEFKRIYAFLARGGKILEEE